MSHSQSLENSQESLIYLMDDNDSIYISMALLLSATNMRLKFFNYVDDLINAIKKEMPSCLLIELNLKPDSGLKIYQLLKTKELAPPTIFLATYSDISTVVKIMQTGVLDFIEKPFTEVRLIKSIEQAVNINSPQLN